MNGKKNGKGIEYEYEFNHNMKYEGEFLNGEKNGKGKEYILDNLKEYSILIFDGEFYNNKRLRGKEYYEDGKLKFEGEYLNGDKWKGKFKEYHQNELVFEGEYLDGLN